MLLNLGLFFVFSFIVTFLLVPVNIRFSNTYQLLDNPSQRSIHKNPIPLAGGLSIAIPVIILQFYSYFLQSDGKVFLALALGGIAILLVGYFDDKRKFGANIKLFFQISIVIVLYFYGFRIHLITNPFGESIELGIFSFPVTIIWFLLVMNALNLIDGLDGLATGISAIVLLVLFSVSVLYRNPITMTLSITLLASCLAFLRFNFYPAKIFLGDTGSLFIGLNIAAISAAGTAQYKGITTMTLLIPIIALIIPFSDTLIAIFRRIRAKKHIFEADKKHLHHKMLELGFSQRTIALTGYFITVLFGLIAFGFSFVSQKVFLGILFLLCMIIFILILIHKELHK
jgi:UDP-GlcNAc:undecaprenyl-phosphate GlcNAc-1-phosphate transferase